MDKPRRLNDIELEECKQKEAFAKWRLSLGFDARTDKERALTDYVNGLLTEIADLKAQLHHAKESNE